MGCRKGPRSVRRAHEAARRTPPLPLQLPSSRRQRDGDGNRPVFATIPQHVHTGKQRRLYSPTAL